MKASSGLSKGRRGNGASHRGRFALIIGLIAINVVGSLVSVSHQKYPLGLGPVLFLLPCLLREFDLRNGKPLRRLGSFEWSCFIAGFLFVFVMPFLLR
jgi:hypothetical protein